MNISLPESMKAFIDEQVASRGYSTSSEYMRDLIRREQDREHLRQLLLDGAASPKSPLDEEALYQELQDQISDYKTE